MRRRRSRLPRHHTGEIDIDDASVVGQDRAVEAVAFAVGMPHKGFNLFVLGEEGTGRATMVRRFLEREAHARPVPSDWCYVNNFVDRRRPKALSLPAGRGRVLHDNMKRPCSAFAPSITRPARPNTWRWKLI